MNIKRMGMNDLIHPFPDRNPRPKAKNHHRHQKRPEIGFLAITKRMLLVGLLVRQPDTKQKQSLISGINQRMDPF